MTDDDLDIVRLAATFYRYRGSREQAIRDRFGVSPARFWQRVTRLVNDPEIEAALPMEVHRLRRQRASAAAVRGLRRLSA